MLVSLTNKHISEPSVADGTQHQLSFAPSYTHSTNMAAAVLPAPHDVSTTLNYYKPLGDPSEEAYRYIYLAPPAGRLEHNLGEDPHPVVVHDARGCEAEFSLDVHGFQFLAHESAETEFEDEERIKGVYYKETEELLEKATGAKRVVIFDHTIRSVITGVHEMREWEKAHQGMLAGATRTRT